MRGVLASPVTGWITEEVAFTTLELPDVDVGENTLGEVMETFFAEVSEVDSDAFPAMVALQYPFWLLVRHACPAEQQNSFGLGVAVVVQYAILRESVEHSCPEAQQSWFAKPQ